MNPEYQSRLNGWCDEEVESFKTKGATDEDLNEPVFAGLVLTTVIKSHANEIRADREFAREVFQMALEHATPEQLRRMAMKDREDGNLELAFQWELIADQRERGEWIAQE
jgi:hypothetical protein